MFLPDPNQVLPESSPNVLHRRRGSLRVLVVSICLCAAAALVGCDDDLEFRGEVDDDAETPEVSVDSTEVEEEIAEPDLDEPETEEEVDEPDVEEEVSEPDMQPEVAEDVAPDVPEEDTRDTAETSEEVIDLEMDMSLPEGIPEQEPNNGGTPSEFNDVELGRYAGTIGSPGDVDIYRLDGDAGRVYMIEIVLPPGSALTEPQLTVFDAGHDGSPGDDYTKIINGAGTLTYMGMASGDYFIGVEDLAGGGSSAHSYQLVITDMSARDYETGQLGFPGDIDSGLSEPGDLHIYRFTGFRNDEVVIDLSAAGGPTGSLDGRLWIWSESSGDWIARNDDRAGSDDPLIDAPITETGTMYLLVENVKPEAGDLSYKLVSIMKQ